MLALLAAAFFLIADSRACFSADDLDSAQNANDLVSQATESLSLKKKSFSVSLPETPKIVTEKTEEAPAEAGGPAFLVKKISIEGCTLFPAEMLDRYKNEYEGKKVTFAEIKGLVDILTALYRSQGYTTSRAYLPPQKIKDGLLTIKVIEGRIGNIYVKENRYFSSQIYQDAVHLREDRIFRYQDLETSLYFFNQKTDRSAKAYLAAGKTPETSDLILKAEEQNPFHAYYTYNNHGTKLTHRSRHEIHLGHNNFLGYADSVLASLTLAEENAINAFNINYSFPIEKTGTTFDLGTSYVESSLIGHLKPFDVDGRSLDIFPSVTQKFIQTPAFSLDGFLGFEYKDSKTTLSGSKTDFDRTRALQAGPRFVFQDVQGRTYVSGDVHIGIPGFLGGLEENDPNASRINAGGNFSYYTANIARIQRLPFSSYMILKGAGQWTRDTLTSSESYRLGGAYTVRGYPESESSGDYGFNGSAEVNFPIWFLREEWKVPFVPQKISWKEAFRLAAFLDGGKTFTRERESGSFVKDKRLFGAGFGFRFNLGPNLSIQFDFGWPIGDDSSDKNHPQAHISVRGGF